MPSKASDSGLIAEFVERGRGLQHQGRRHIESWRDRIEETAMAARLRQTLESGQQRLATGRVRLERWADDRSRRLLGARERLLHQLGLATTRDVQQMTRKLSTLRSQVKGVLPTQSAGRSKRRNVV